MFISNMLVDCTRKTSLCAGPKRAVLGMRRVFGHYVWVAALALSAAEAVLITGIFWFGVFYALGLDGFRVSREIVPWTLFAAVVVVAVIHSIGLYDRDALGDLRRSLALAIWTTVPTFAVCLLVSTLIQRYAIAIGWHGKWELALGLTAACLAALSVGRIALAQLHANGVFTKRIFVIGGAEYRASIRNLSCDLVGSFEVTGELDAHNDALLLANAPYGRLPNDASLSTLVRQANASEIVIPSTLDAQLPWQELVQCKLAGIPIISYPRFYERERQMIDIDTLSADWFVSGDGFHIGLVARAIKRGFDVVGSLVGLLLVAPVMVMAAIAIKLDSPGPVLYRQARVGLGGSTFMIFKFRSMHSNAEQNGEPRWADEHDSRITRVGRLLRKYRVDELPQFFNVIRGDMSFIGPRPERPFFVERLASEIPFFAERHAIKPGITGWAQVSYHYGASIEDARRKLSYDLYYLKNQGLFLDLIILIRTVHVILWASGAR